jgi:pyruvate,water dikinase
MVASEISGITFTVNPLDNQSLLIEASIGLGDLVVGGEVQPDDFTVDRKTLEITTKKTEAKTQKAQHRGARPTTRRPEPSLESKQVLADTKIEELARICMKVENLFQYPQDIEWCIEQGKIWLLQARPISCVRT